MKTFLTENYKEWGFKDAPYPKTLFQIKSILMDLGIDTVQRCHNLDAEMPFFSMSIHDAKCNILRSNGKGSTNLQSEASAYAEFMERLQSYFLISRDHNNPYFSDEIVDENKNVLVPFVNMQTKQIDYLFHKETNVSSTGLASGNTYPEAMVSALSEVLERYLLQLFCNQELISKGIISEDLLNSSNKKIIQYLSKRKKAVLIHDISLNTEYPCVLVVVLDNIYRTCGFRIGCAPTLNIAIERGLTELYQGIVYEEKEKCYNPIEDIEKNVIINYFNYATNGQGVIPKKTITPFLMPTAKIIKNPFKDFENNEMIIKHLIQVLPQYVGNIWVRDLGFLGFPTVRVYSTITHQEATPKNVENFTFKKEYLDYYTEILLNSNNKEQIAYFYENYLARIVDKDKADKERKTPYYLSLHDKLKNLSLIYQSKNDELKDFLLTL